MNAVNQFLNELQGSLANESFRKLTLGKFRGEWSDLRQHLEKGRPLVVALKSGSGDALHYVVVTGLDAEQGPVLVNDPAQRKLLKQDKSAFLRSWSAVGNWTLLALPQTTVP